jgi:predicted enzyme related to lactoylglutathione lyase
MKRAAQKKPGAINGGFFQKTDDKPAQYPSVVIAVDDIKEHIKEVEKAGGRVLVLAVSSKLGHIA